jgi:gamma-glutamyltranspeptidase / glutathione hydrolase
VARFPCPVLLSTSAGVPVLATRHDRPPRGVVAAGHPETVAAALTVLEAGGNAFDAVVAAGFAAAVVEPCLSSLGGGGFLLARTAAGEEVVFDFFVDTPGRGLPDAVAPQLTPVTLQFGAAAQVFHVGHGSVAVPGCLPGYLHAHARLGRLDLEAVVAPARRLAERGAPLGPHQTAVVHLLEPILTLSAEGQGRFTPAGRRLAPEDRVTNPRLAAFLEEVGAGRAHGFVDPPLAAAIEADMVANGGLLTAADLVAYQVVEREPLAVDYRGVRLLTNPPPSFGGRLIAQGLALLAAEPVSDFGSGPRLARLADVFDEVMRHHTDADASIAPDAHPEVAGPSAGAAGSHQGPAGSPPPRRRPTSVKGTTHVSICDDEGNLAAMTTSNGSCSGVMLGDTGVMANNIMGEEDLQPHLRAAEDDPRAQHPRPGIRVGSMMAPSLLLPDDGAPVVLGSGGSERIRTAMTQVIVDLVDHGMSLAEAVDAPRIHWDGTAVQVEPGFATEATQHLADRRPTNVWQVSDLYFGGVHAVSPDGARAGDPRRGGSTGLLPAD